MISPKEEHLQKGQALTGVATKRQATETLQRIEVISKDPEEMDYAHGIAGLHMRRA